MYPTIVKLNNGKTGLAIPVELFGNFPSPDRNTVEKFFYYLFNELKLEPILYNNSPVSCDKLLDIKFMTIFNLKEKKSESDAFVVEIKDSNGKDDENGKDKSS